MARMLVDTVLALCLVVGGINHPVHGGDTDGGPNVTLVFRFDDYSSGSCGTQDQRILATFRRHRCPLTIGVIPFMVAGDYHDPTPQKTIPLTAADFQLLREAVGSGTAEVALHGFSHQTCRPREQGGWSEFSGVDLDSQVERIARGKAALEEGLKSRIVTFIPPWNSYDVNTLEALERLHFKVISAGGGGPIDRRGPGTWLPATCGLLDIRAAVQRAREIECQQAIIICLFHRSDFRSIDPHRGTISFTDLEQLLSWVASQENLQILTLADVADRHDSIGVAAFEAYKERSGRGLTRFLPQFLRSSGDKLVFVPGGKPSLGVKARHLALLTCFYGVVAVAFFALANAGGKALFARLPAVRFPMAISGPIASAALLAYALRDFGIGPKGLIVCTASVGLSLGVCTAAFRLARQRATAQPETEEAA